MFHADTLYDNEENFGLPEIEERDLSASLTLRWSRKRQAVGVPQRLLLAGMPRTSGAAAARTADITMASAACGPC